MSIISFLSILKAYISSIVPGKLNYNNISKNIGLDDKTVNNYLNILNDDKKFK